MIHFFLSQKVVPVALSRKILSQAKELLEEEKGTTANEKMYEMTIFLFIFILSFYSALRKSLKLKTLKMMKKEMNQKNMTTLRLMTMTTNLSWYVDNIILFHSYTTQSPHNTTQHNTS